MRLKSSPVFTAFAIIALSCRVYASEVIDCNDFSDKVTPAKLAVTPANRFLDSLGVNLHIDQGYNASSYVIPLRYLGVRQARDGSRHVESMISVVRSTGVHFSMISGGDMNEYLSAARMLAQAGGLLAIEGPNEPNNFPIEYKGRKGGQSFGWSAIAEYQRDLYTRTKTDPILTGYMVFAPSEVGAESDNVGLQFLEIPSGSAALFPEGTVFADYANVHNYVSGVRGGLQDNQAWNAADPVLRGRWDGLAGNNGMTWARRFKGYSDTRLASLARVTTETGYSAGESLDEQRMQGIVLINTYLSQYVRGWSYTYIYELRDNEGGSSYQGIYAGDRPKLAADYIHNLTTILYDVPGQANSYTGEVLFSAGAVTVHALNLVKRDGKMMLVIWNERVSGSDPAIVDFSTSRSVKIYDVIKGVDAIATTNVFGKICLDVGSHALVVEY